MAILQRRKTNRVRPPAKPRKARRPLPMPDWARLTAPLRLAVVPALLAAGAVLVWQVLDRPVTSIAVTAPFQRVTEIQIEDVVRSALDGGILSADLTTMRTRLEEMAWVDKARIQRRWPGTLQIRVTEQVAAARWGDTGLLNTRGELFVSDARHLPAELPRLDGPDGSQWQVAQRYLALRGPLLEAGLQLLAVRMDSRGGWWLSLSRGIEVRLGRDAVDKRIARLLEVVTPMIAGRSERIDYVDLRYANGFAIGWNRAPETAVAANEEEQAGA